MNRTMRPTISLYGKENAISISRDVVRLLSVPTHICILCSSDGMTLAVKPCEPDHLMSFKVPERFLKDDIHFRIYSQQFVRSLLEKNGRDPMKTYTITGVFNKKLNVIYFGFASR